MAMKFFAIPALDPTTGEDELNAFLRSHRSVSVVRQLATTGDRVVWCVAVEYLEAGLGRSGGTAYANGDRKNRIDYREILRPADFVVFSRLRELRKQFAETERVPVYAVFTNEQLALIAQQRPSSAAALLAIDGIGDAKAERYAERVLALLAELAEPPAAGPGPASA
jgi:superfamily II DNA helicase RecQ